MAYYYIVLPWKHTEPVFNRLFAYTVYGSLEATFTAYRTPADVLRLVDGTVTYRMQEKYLDKYKSDSQGTYINLYSFGIVRFVEEDPTLTTKPVTSREDWIPVGNG
jgi:hypothetical protein